MTKKEALEIFIKNDDPIYWWICPDLDYEQAMNRFRKFVEDLDRATGECHEIRAEGDIQDASFHSEIRLGNGWLRFSYFGDMVAMTPAAQISEEERRISEELLLEHKYVLVPTELTQIPYTGNNPGVGGIETWWIRYFDYI